MTSAACTVKVGAAAPVATTNGVTATAAAAIIVQLSDLSVSSWSFECFGTDETATAPTITINQTTKTATFTMTGAGTALGFRSTADGVVATFGIFVPVTANGRRVLFASEGSESSATFGWIADVNAPIRAAAASRPTRTLAIANVAGDGGSSNHDGATYVGAAGWTGNVACSGGVCKVDVSVDVGYDNVDDDLKCAVFVAGVLFGTVKTIRMPAAGTTSTQFSFSVFGTPTAGTKAFSVRFLPVPVDSGVARFNSYNHCTLLVTDDGV